MNAINTWPLDWLEAASRAGFAMKKDGAWVFLSPEMREKLAQFASDIYRIAAINEKNGEHQ